MKQGTSGFLRSGSFKKKQFEEDKERLITYCRNQGFLDAAITGTKLNFDDARERLEIVVELTEGERYYVGDVRWQGNTVLDDLAVADRVLLQKARSSRRTSTSRPWTTCSRSTRTRATSTSPSNRSVRSTTATSM